MKTSADIRPRSPHRTVATSPETVVPSTNLALMEQLMWLNCGEAGARGRPFGP
jgi:hypothetical protein